MRTVSGIGRVAAVAAVVAAVVVVGVLLFSGGGGYTVQAYFINGNQLVKGNQVELDGTPIGSVKDLDLTPNGQAVVTLKIKSEYAPLHHGVIARIVGHVYVERTDLFRRGEQMKNMGVFHAPIPAN